MSLLAGRESDVIDARVGVSPAWITGHDTIGKFIIWRVNVARTEITPVGWDVGMLARASRSTLVPVFRLDVALHPRKNFLAGITYSKASGVHPTAGLYP